ncbi:hypothetical protein JW978_03605 [Candidatus Dojkabacteria bacterium]|nr:hypothetical protein [Candidatus Dojkabacteria bacterium]
MKNKWLVIVVLMLFLCMLSCIFAMGGYFIYREYYQSADDEKESIEDETMAEPETEESEDEEQVLSSEPFEFSVEEIFVAGSSLTFSGIMPTDSEVVLLDSDNLDRAVISGRGFDLYFNLFYEAYNLEYEVLEENVVSNAQFGDLHRYNDLSSSSTSYGYTNSLSSHYCDAPGSPIGVNPPCGNGAVSFTDNVGESFFFLSCVYSTPGGLESCDDIVSTLEVVGER